MNPWREALILRQSNPQKEISTTNTRVVVVAAVIETLASLDLAYPKVDEDKLKELATAKKKLLNK
jgi:hypothetical protein